MSRRRVVTGGVGFSDFLINHFDIKNQMEVMTKMTRIAEERGVTTLIVMHDSNIAIRVCD
jgi:ABC-type cobalamin/Fe3+-siderophores transport system ATPase subunit